MGILSDIERLINEHASAAVLKERIALAEDKYAALDRRVKELADENARLQSENADLRAKVREQSEPTVEEIGDKILILLSKYSDVRVDQIAGEFGIGKELAAFHVEELENSGLIYGSYSTMSPATYGLEQEGRRYLIKKGLLK